MEPKQDTPPPVPPPPRVPAWRLFRAFALVGLCAFGGVMPWVHRSVVEKEKWLDEQEFTELWSVGMLLPGATSTNVAASLGYRLNAPLGAGAAVLGLLGPPMAIVLVLAVLYQRYGMVPAVHGAVRGVTAVAAGLVIATALKLAKSQPLRPSVLLFGLAAFLGVTVLRWPLLAVVGGLIPLSVASEWRATR